MEDRVTISFYGGAENPTGSNFLVSSKNNPLPFLIDCGLFQGCRICEHKNREPFAYDIKSIKRLFVTHAHIDHVGRIPKLVHDGFSGEIISTAPTKDLSDAMLVDSADVLFHEAKADNLPPFYTKEDVVRTMSLWRAVPYHEQVVHGDFSIVLKDAGHILGSAYIECTHKNGKQFVFSGDLGNSPAPLLSDTEPLDKTHILVVESVYGDRNHEQKDDRRQILEQILEETAKKKGTLIVPAFSLERTQDLLYEINALVEGGKIPQMPVFIDSPLAIEITAIYKKHENYFNKKTQQEIKKGDDIFKFPGLIFTYTRKESQDIAKKASPKIIIAGSGMSNGGRITYHEKHYLPDPKNILLIVGYQAPGSLGRALQEGAKEVTIFGERVPVRAEIRTLFGYSAHKDSEHLLEFIATAQDTLEEVLVVLGEPKSSLFLVQRIRDYLGLRARMPKFGETATFIV